jgi:diguanylate cyclase (GGDEF)-like protein
MVATDMMSPIAAARTKSERGGRQAGRPDRAAALALSAFTSMSRAVAIVGPDGQLLLPNSMFEKLFGATDLLGLINPDAMRNDGKSDRQIELPDGRTFWVETIPMEGGFLVSAYDMTERKAKARIDTLTKLGNRLMFGEELARLLANPAVAASDIMAVLTVDLHRFKAINESLGRATGDGLLTLVGQRIRATVESGDIVARLGGDKFAVIQAGQPQPQSAAALALRLIDQIGRSYLLDGQSINTTASVGIVMFRPGESDCEQILRKADLALHDAKSEGQRNYRFYEPAMEEKKQARRNLEVDLRRALAHGEFTLDYQPQFNLRSNKVTGFEALLRWHCPARGRVSPAEFIPVAEETGIIIPIGEWVIRTACLEAMKWPGTRSVAVNVSAVQFGSPDLVPVILSALDDSGLDPGRLEIEITESVFLDARGTAHAVLECLREMGVRISLDDFGTGYASLGYLRSFPFDKIKIDQSFIRGAAADVVGRAIARTIASLGESLGMTTLAEGVETEEQMARVVADGCTDVQGYLISRPLPADQVGGFLQSRETECSDRNVAVAVKSLVLQDLV